MQTPLLSEHKGYHAVAQCNSQSPAAPRRWHGALLNCFGDCGAVGCGSCLLGRYCSCVVFGYGLLQLCCLVLELKSCASGTPQQVMALARKSSCPGSLPYRGIFVPQIPGPVVVLQVPRLCVASQAQPPQGAGHSRLAGGRRIFLPVLLGHLLGLCRSDSHLPPRPCSVQWRLATPPPGPTQAFAPEWGPAMVEFYTSHNHNHTGPSPSPSKSKRPQLNQQPMTSPSGMPVRCKCPAHKPLLTLTLACPHPEVHC